MKYLPKITALFAIILIFSACEKIKLPESTPECVSDQIRELRKESCPSVATVHRFQFQNETVYLFSPKDCGNDLTTTIYTEDCQVLCHLGGIAGTTVCNGDTFYLAATDEELIWEE